jgi:hypothetical protein
MKGRSESKGEVTSVERGVLTDVAQKVGTAVGTIVSALSRPSAQGSKKTTTENHSSRSPGAKTSRRQSRSQPGKTGGAEHSPLKRRRRKSKSTK